jgi:hypothetical protein
LGGRRLGAVRAAFDLSYRRLEPAPARLFRLLSLNPGPDIATDAAAALTGQPTGPARTLLAALARTSLIKEQPVGSGRWRMHDLIRLYAADLARTDPDRDGREAALDRLLEHYRATADAADDHLHALPDRPVPDRFRSSADALAWFDRERPNLVDAVVLAAAQGRAHRDLARRVS